MHSNLLHQLVGGWLYETRPPNLDGRPAIEYMRFRYEDPRSEAFLLYQYFEGYSHRPGVFHTVWFEGGFIRLTEGGSSFGRIHCADGSSKNWRIRAFPQERKLVVRYLAKYERGSHRVTRKRLRFEAPDQLSVAMWQKVDDEWVSKDRTVYSRQDGECEYDSLLPCRPE